MSSSLIRDNTSFLQCLLSSVGNLGYIYSFGDTYSSSGRFAASSMLFDASASGGLGLAASHASGPIIFYSGGGSERMTLAADGSLTVDTDTLFVDGGFGYGGPYYYKVSALDINENESDHALLTPDGGLITDLGFE